MQESGGSVFTPRNTILTCAEIQEKLACGDIALVRTGQAVVSSGIICCALTTDRHDALDCPTSGHCMSPITARVLRSACCNRRSRTVAIPQALVGLEALRCAHKVVWSSSKCIKLT